MISRLKHKISLREYEFSKHAVDQSILRDISVPELEEALLGDCIIVEDYPDDKYGPSFLILGFTNHGRPLHILCSYPFHPVLKIITLYQPEPSDWQDYRIRVKWFKEPKPCKKP